MNIFEEPLNDIENKKMNLTALTNIINARIAAKNARFGSAKYKVTATLHRKLINEYCYKSKTANKEDYMSERVIAALKKELINED